MGRIFWRLASLMLVVSIGFGATARAADATLHPWRIEVSGGADSHGEIVFSFSEDAAEITQISVAIPKGTPENNVARRIRKELRRALSRDDYAVDRHGGEEILVSAIGPARNHEFRLVRNTVSGTKITIARE